MKPKKPVKRGNHQDNVKAQIKIEIMKDGSSRMNVNNINQNLEGLRLIEKELSNHLRLLQDQKIQMMLEAKTQPKIAVAPANTKIIRNMQ